MRRWSSGHGSVRRSGDRERRAWPAPRAAEPSDLARAEADCGGAAIKADFLRESGTRILPKTLMKRIESGAVRVWGFR